jgi:hypothetical protein
VEEAEEDIAAMALNFNFVDFGSLGAQIGVKMPFDVVGVVKEVGEQGVVKRKSDNTDIYKREIKLVDSSCVSRPSHPTSFGPEVALNWPFPYPI